MNEVEKKGIGKSQVGLIVAVVFIAILAVSSVWLYLRVDSLETEASNLQLNKYSLQTSVTNLQTEVSNLTSDNYNLERDVNILTTENEDLQNQVDDLTTLTDGLEDEIDWLNQKYDNYVAYYQYSNWEYDEAQFYFYYVLPEEQNLGVYDLDDDLYGYEWIDPYQRGVFDCSEMSAYMEWELENMGWHAKIVVGDSPFGSGRHAWLLVETSEGKYMPIEPTTIEIVWWDDPYYDDYWEYDRSFETIQDALAYSETEFDWWT